MKRTRQFLIYGATGFTGKLTARTAKERGLQPILAGRNEAKLKAIAQPLGFSYRVFELSDAAALDAALGEVDAVLHIAGPFSATSKPMADACLRMGVHYLDITGEIDVFEVLAQRDAEARKAGIMMLPGVGFDVVPSDCLALHLKQRLPDAIDLKIYIGGLNALSHGTAKSMVEAVPLGTRVRRDGRIITPSPRPQETICDFGDGPTPTIVIPWHLIERVITCRSPGNNFPNSRGDAIGRFDTNHFHNHWCPATSSGRVRCGAVRRCGSAIALLNETKPGAASTGGDNDEGTWKSIGRFSDLDFIRGYGQCSAG